MSSEICVGNWDAHQEQGCEIKVDVGGVLAIVNHSCSAEVDGKCTYARYIAPDGRRYCKVHVPPELRLELRANCTHALFDPTISATCCWCGGTP